MNAENEILRLTPEQVFSTIRTDTFIRRMQRLKSALQSSDGYRIIKIDQTEVKYEDAITVGQAKILKKRAAMSFMLANLGLGLDDEDYNRLVRGEFNEPPPKFDSPDICPDGHSMKPRFAETKKEIVYWRCLACDYFSWPKPL